MCNQEETRRLCDETCSICYEEMEPDAAGVVTLFCGHKFHAQCILDWMQLGNAACPNCRKLHPKHKDHAASRAGTQEEEFREGDFSDSASEAEETMESHFIEKASKDSDPVAKRLYGAFDATTFILDHANLSLFRQRKVFFRERRKLRKELMKEMAKKLREGRKEIRNGPIGKDYTRALRRRSYARQRCSLMKRNILNHYANN